MTLADPPLRGRAGMPGPQTPDAEIVRAFAGFAAVIATVDAGFAGGSATARTDIRPIGIRPAAPLRLAHPAGYQR